MNNYLMFQLYGPMAAWGDIAVGQYRPSFAHPSKSSIIGLLAAALGIRRDEEERQKSLTESCSFAVLVESMGTLMRDYHTTQVPSAQKGKVHYTRQSELETADLNTILSSRDYRCDAAYIVAISVVEGSPFSLSQLASALTKPVFTIYLGRKSCPLAMPLNPQIVTSHTLCDAFEYVLPANELRGIILKAPQNVYWENDSVNGFELQQVVTRRDEPLSRRRWQFGDRRENCGVLRKEEEPCTSA